MAVSVDAATMTKLRELFEHPTLEGMLALEWSAFEEFVKHVFESAGFAVERVSSRPKFNVDLVLYANHVGGRVVARVEVRRYRTANIIRGKVFQFYGAIIAKGTAPGYIVTTSDFTKPAYEAAEDTNGKVKLINGARFLRYIRYVQGSRVLDVGGEAPDIRQPLISPDYLFQAEAIPRRNIQETKVLAIANNKGGVAKTTTALNLALVLTLRHNQRVLLIDMDGQASLTALLPRAASKPRRGRQNNAQLEPPPSDAAFVSDYLAGQRTLSELVRSTRFDRLWLIPSDPRLTQLDSNGSVLTDKVLGFIQDLHKHDFAAPDGLPFDWIILDTPPAQSFCTRAAVAASHFVLIPACAETVATRSANGALMTAGTMHALSGLGAQVVGAVITRWRHTPQADQVLVGLVDLLRKYNSRVFLTRIQDDSRIERGNSNIAGGGLRHLFRITLGPAARAYEDLVKEMMPYV